jgi:transcriptional regulator with XRE-family HTH domain
MAKQSVAIQVGRALRARREAAGLSQDQFADHIDMHRAYYAAIERGEKNITLSTLKRLTDGLRVAMSDILRDIGN